MNGIKTIIDYDGKPALVNEHDKALPPPFRAHSMRQVKEPDYKKLYEAIVYSLNEVLECFKSLKLNDDTLEALAISTELEISEGLLPKHLSQGAYKKSPPLREHPMRVDGGPDYKRLFELAENVILMNRAANNVSDLIVVRNKLEDEKAKQGIE